LVDNLSPIQRSQCMRAVKGENTSTEMRVRKLVHSMGFRYTLHVPSLPGKPDIVLPAHRKIIFVHGCFWHKHNCRRGRRLPATRQPYWIQKRQRNAARDREHIKALRRDGWKVLAIWECWAGDLDSLRCRLREFLKD